MYLFGGVKIGNEELWQLSRWTQVRGDGDGEKQMDGDEMQ